MQAVSKTQVKVTQSTEQKIISDKNNKGFFFSNILSQIKNFLLSDIEVIKVDFNSSGSYAQEHLPDESYQRTLEAKHAKLSAYINNNGFIR